MKACRDCFLVEGSQATTWFKATGPKSISVHGLRSSNDRVAVTAAAHVVVVATEYTASGSIAQTHRPS